MPEHRKPRPPANDGMRAKHTKPERKPEKHRSDDDAGARADVRGERIAKRIARSGVASRRNAEAMIAEGRVKVNGNVLKSPAFNVSDTDIIIVDGQRLPDKERTRLFLFHKPSGTMTTNRDPEGRKTVFDALPADLPRLMTVGRLDFTTEGLLLMTNDGGLARVLELPSTGWLRRYRVRVHGEVDEAALERLKEGIAVEGVLYGAIDAALERKQGSNAWLTVALREGKNREIKNVLGALGLEVTRLIRVSYGPFQLGGLEAGGVMELKGRLLRDQLGDRLISEAGADFDAPIAKPFSNKPVKKTPAETSKPARQAGRDKQSFREEALDRLQTSKPRKPGLRGKPEADRGRAQDAKGETAEKKRGSEPPRSRASNVWMAPGARPSGGKAKRAGVKTKSESHKTVPYAGRKSRREDTGKSGASPKAGKKDADRRR